MDNAIGWILMVAAGVFAVSGFAQCYAIYALFTNAGSLPAGRVAGWLWSWTPYVGLGLVGTFLLLLFPDGRLPSRHWRIVAWLAAGSLVVLFLGSFAPRRLGGFDDITSVRNPFGIDAAGGVFQQLNGSIAWTVLVVSILASASSFVVRLRRAKGEERLQLKWFAYAATLLAVGFVALSTTDGESWVGIAPWLAGLVALPLAIGVAIFRYRLYEIDVIIRRTLVYGGVTASLAGLYFAIVLLLQQVFSSFAGGSDLAIAGSTLAVAALFRPVRNRMQALVDRRFYRRRYDTQRTLEAFSARLRDEIDLGAMRSELVAVVEETMQPERVSLWLRQSGARR
jgi:hypothetical protein